MIRNLARCPYCGDCEIALDDRPDLVFNPDGPLGPCPHLAWVDVRFARFMVNEQGADHMFGSNDFTWGPVALKDDELAEELTAYLRELLIEGAGWSFAATEPFTIKPLSAEERTKDETGHDHLLWEVDGSAIYAADAKTFWDALPACRQRQLAALDMGD